MLVISGESCKKGTDTTRSSVVRAASYLTSAGLEGTLSTAVDYLLSLGPLMRKQRDYRPAYKQLSVQSEPPRHRYFFHYFVSRLWTFSLLSVFLAAECREVSLIDSLSVELIDQEETV